MNPIETTAFFTRPLSVVTKEWRIFYEESAELNPRSERTDFEELRGVADTRIYRHSQDTFAVSSDSPRMQTRLSRIHGVTPKSGSVFLFPDDRLDTVATVIKAKRARQYTEEQRQAVRERLARWQFPARSKEALPRPTADANTE